MMLLSVSLIFIVSLDILQRNGNFSFKIPSRYYFLYLYDIYVFSKTKKGIDQYPCPLFKKNGF